jgi:YVTN family beta-propeller protein
MRIQRCAVVVWSVLTIAAACFGQRLEAVIPLPDTFVGAAYPEYVAYNSANDCFYVASSSDTTVIVIDGATGAKVALIHLPREVCAIGCNPATNKVYFAAGDNEVVVVDGRTNRIRTLVAVGYDPIALAFDSLANKVYCANSSSASVTVIDGTTDRTLATLDLGRTFPSALCCVPTAGRTYCGTDSGLVVIDSRTDSIRAWIAPRWGGDAVGIVWSPVHNRVYYAAEDTIWVVDAASDSVLAWIEPPNDCYFTGGLAYGAALDQVYTLDDDYGNLLVIDCGRDTVVDAIPFVDYPPDDLGGFCADPFAGKVYCVDEGDSAGLLTVCDVAERMVNRIPAGLWPVALAPSTRDHRLLCADFDGSAALVIDAEHDSLLATVGLYDWPRVVLPSRDGSKLYVGCDCGALLALDAETGSLLTRFDFFGSLRALCLGPSGHRLYCASYGADSVRVIDTDADTLVAQFAVGHSPATLYYDSLRGKIYCVCPYDPSITVLDAASGNVLDSIKLVSRPRLVCHDPVAGRVYAYSYSSSTHRVSVIDCDRDSVVADVVVRRKLSALCSNPNRNELCAACAGRDTLIVIDGVTDSIVAAITVGGELTALSYNPVRNRMYCILSDSSLVEAIDCNTRSVVARIPVGPRPESLWYNPASNHLFCGLWGPDAVAVIDAATDSVIATIGVRGNPAGFADNRTGDRVYVTCSGVPFVNVISDRLPDSPVTSSGGSTLFRGKVYLLGSDPARLVNTAGRVVATLVPGDNNISRLPPGVYFAVPVQKGRQPSKLVIFR